MFRKLSQYTRSRKILFLLSALLVVGLCIRLAAPGIILRQLNSRLANFSPHYSIHISDLDFALWRMAYNFENIEFRQKRLDRAFLEIRDVDVSLAWRELLQLNFVADIDVDQARLSMDPEIIKFMTQTKKSSATEAKQAGRSLVPFRIERFRIFNSSLSLKDLPQIPFEQSLRLTGLNASLTNLIPSKADPRTDFEAKGKMMDSAPFKADGQADLLAKPLRWSVDGELKNFDLRALNTLLMRVLPLSFEKGQLDLYSEIKSEKGEIRGSVRPFADHVELVGDRKDFKNLKHGTIEVLAAIATTVLENSKDGTLATQIDFTVKNGKFQMDTAKAIEQSLRHGFGEALPRRIE